MLLRLIGLVCTAHLPLGRNCRMRTNTIAYKLHVSPNYLGGLLKSLAGLNTQQHIHEKLMEVAKQKLSTTDLTVSEIAYNFGFEHLPSFSKLFKQKTGQSPVSFRHGFRN